MDENENQNNRHSNGGWYTFMELGKTYLKAPRTLEQQGDKMETNENEAQCGKTLPTLECWFKKVVGNNLVLKGAKRRK